MSYAYDEYLAEHIGNVNKGLHWMLDNLGLSQEEKTAIETAMTEFNHDESKYSIEEYNAYDQYFYGGNRSYKVVQDFSYAWLHHIHQNPHHWQYWVLLEDDPEAGLPYETLPIPLPYIFEMIADWWSFSWKAGNLFEIFNWYAEHRDRQYIHPESRKIVERVLEKIWDVLIMQETIAGHDVSEIEAQYKRFWIEQDVDLLNWDHSSAQKIGKVVDAHETENGLEITVEHSDEDEHLEHHGILGQKWGVRNGPPYPLDGSNAEFKSPHELSTFMREFKYSEYDKLQSPEETRNKKSGSCHDQVMYELQELRKMGYAPNAKFVIEYDPKTNQGGTTHSFAYYKDGDKIVWFENAWGGKEGLHNFNSEQEMLNYIRKNWDSADSSKYTGLEITDFKESKHKAGESLQELVDICLDDELEHSDISKDEEDLYGVPELKKFPMPDKKHVKSAIRFFNYVDPKYEKELAEAILEKAKEFGVVFDADITVGDENRLKKYLPKKKEES